MTKTVVWKKVRLCRVFCVVVGLGLGCNEADQVPVVLDRPPESVAQHEVVLAQSVPEKKPWLELKHVGYGAACGPTNKTIGKTRVYDSLELDAVVARIQKDEVGLRACLTQHVSLDEDREPNSFIQIQLAKSGRVIDTTLRFSRLKIEAADQCVIDRLADLVFPESDNGGRANIWFPSVLDL